jgi:hypothetical protein
LLRCIKFSGACDEFVAKNCRAIGLAAPGARECGGAVAGASYSVSTPIAGEEHIHPITKSIAKVVADVPDII